MILDPEDSTAFVGSASHFWTKGPGRLGVLGLWSAAFDTKVHKKIVATNVTKTGIVIVLNCAFLLLCISKVSYSRFQ
jgi:hypothetical protein